MKVVSVLSRLLLGTGFNFSISLDLSQGNMPVWIGFPVMVFYVAAFSDSCESRQQGRVTFVRCEQQGVCIMVHSMLDGEA